MNFYYRNAVKPKGSVVYDKMQAACKRLYDKLIKFNVEGLDVSDYNKRYFGGKVNTNQDVFYNLLKYNYLLTWSLLDYNGKLEDFVFVDHGAGHGMMSLLAKELGIGTVIHTDIYEQSCFDAKVIGEALNIPADHYVPGEMDDLKKYLLENNIEINCISSYDVIEHIYDMPEFLRYLPSLPRKPKMHVFFGSGANEANSSIKKTLREIQIRVENVGSKPVKGFKERDTLLPYLNIRRDYIKANFASLSNTEIEEIASRTRGKILDDVKEICESFLKNKQLPDFPEHPTNTCDPRNGNWMEHFMDPNELVQIMKSAGFEASVKPGYYGVPISFVKKIIAGSVNQAITTTGSLKLCPFYVLQGTLSK